MKPRCELTGGASITYRSIAAAVLSRVRVQPTQQPITILPLPVRARSVALQAVIREIKPPDSLEGKGLCLLTFGQAVISLLAVTLLSSVSNHGGASRSYQTVNRRAGVRQVPERPRITWQAARLRRASKYGPE
ncbi:hypothetical protein THAOC_18825 [Thalassiosira oceanica]|uniref:Uncharacterized protein n=1 Tax=Thalassiosira oceanica TaxID=159749 RepID=K0SR28_THAOC|nr:hypothetical protein THAOC_18825 [Thalassiosira oceanica]|eukprot:EJK60767.1 hypothetical protein THAOC_18825 [Thalassiosira oceanica]